MAATGTSDGDVAFESPFDFEANPYDDSVETTFATYDCGDNVLAPLAEVEKAPDTCPVCGEARADR